MGRQHVSFEWHLVEDEAAWQNLPVQEWGAEPGQLIAAHQTAVNIDQRITLHFLRSLTLCLAGLILVAAVDISPDERARRRAISGISSLLTQETQEMAGSGEAPVTLLLETAPTDGVRGQPTLPIIGLVRVEPIGELTLAEVILNDQPPNWRMTIPYRETRFYQETADGWRQIRPDDAFWGAPMVRETAHLRFEYLARDAATVEPLFQSLDAVYVTAHTFLGVDVPTTSTKLTIELTPAQVTGWGGSAERLRITSPVMAQIPTELSASTYLFHQITSRMLLQIVSTPPTNQSSDSENERSYLAQWRAMRRGLRSWLQHELLAERWPWDRQAATFFAANYQPTEPLTLGALWWGNGQQLNESEQMMWQSAAAESVIAYAVAAHGPEILPKLWRGFHRYETSAEWVAGVFDHTVEEFETGWNQYLAEQQESVDRNSLRLASP